MNLEFDSAGSEPRDRIRWIWIGTILFFVIAGSAVWFLNRTDPTVSTVRAMHILIAFDQNNSADRAEAYDTVSRLRQRIADGESFQTLAREYSDDPSSARRGGDLGYVKKGQFSETIEEFVWTAKPNELSDILLSPYGYHLVVVLDRYLSAADIHQRELEQRVLQRMREEKTETAAPAGPTPAEETPGDTAPAEESPAEETSADET